MTWGLNALMLSAFQCSAIDYMIHNLDSATAAVQNPKSFGNRMSVSEKSVKSLAVYARRLYRLFSHTYFHHHTIFREFESEMHLCSRFTQFSLIFDMMSMKNMNIPREALNIRISEEPGATQQLGGIGSTMGSGKGFDLIEGVSQGGSTMGFGGNFGGLASGNGGSLGKKGGSK